MSYIESLFETFRDVKFEIVNFDNGATPQSMQCYLLASNLDQVALKNKGQTALELGNYVYHRFGFNYEHCPEYYRKDEPKNSLAFYQSKEKFNAEYSEHIRSWILKHEPEAKRPESVLYHKTRLGILHTPPFTESIAIWNKNGQIVIIKKGQFAEVIFEADGKDFKYLQAELGPASDFEIIGDL